MDSKRKILGIIPARYQSTRFPGKPLALVKGRPMVQWVYESVYGTTDYLVVATDDKRIKDVVEGFGGKAVMTSPDHSSGTDRCNETNDILEKSGVFQADIVVNIQGDEPMIRKEHIGALISCFENPETDIATLISFFRENEDPLDPNLVKAVVNQRQQALYFSRSVIPYLKQGSLEKDSIYLKHIGLYGYRVSVLRSICKLPPSRLEMSESLEQLRWLENGFVISTRLTEYDNIGVDTPKDLERLVRHLEGLF